MDESIEEIKTAAELRELLGPAMARALTKDRAELHPVQEQWLRASPFCLLATSAKDGSCDVSPRGDPHGFTLVLDRKTLALPERPGNRRADSLSNLLGNPHVGLIYLVPGRDETLRVNGRARLVKSAPFFDAMVVQGHRPKLAIVVEIEQVFFHCAKAFMRSELWQPQSWRPERLPSYAEISYALQSTGTTLEVLQSYYGPSYAERLYKDGGVAADPPASLGPREPPATEPQEP
jgi:PPOX class probable FMN-dependent enzyme